MLKLTRSFYRFLPHTREHISNKISHVKTFSHLNIKGKTCLSVFNQSTSFNPFIHNKLQWWQLAIIGKRFKIKKPFCKSNADKIAVQMSESFQPTLSHVSYGGQFEVDSDDEADSWMQVEDGRSMENMSRTNESKIKISDIRMWESVETWTNHGNSFKFTIMSYNVLAQYLLECHPYLYTQCSKQDLKWKVRAARLYDEIASLEPDIICLQEVQASHVHSFYSKFEDIGYYGIFKQKTGHRQDGCAIYFKSSMFYLEDHINVEFYQPNLQLLDRDNVGLVVRLRARPEICPAAAAASPLVVATTHLLYNPKRTDIRLAQMQVFLAEVDRFAYCHDGTCSGHYPIILTGDLNSPPNSAVTELLSRGHVSAYQFRDDSDWRRIGVTDNCQHLAVYLNRLKGLSTDERMIKIFNSERYHDSCDMSREYRDAQERELNEAIMQHGAFFNSGELSHPLLLSSVYSQLKSDGSYEATTFQDFWVTVDYIYFSRCGGLSLLKRLRLPTEAECLAIGPLPNDVCASDHLALAATFELRPPNADL